MSPRNTTLKSITTGFILFLILIVVAISLGWKPLFVKFIYLVPGGDKASHFLLMGTLSFFVTITIGASKERVMSKDFLKGSLAILIVVTMEEFSQLFLKTRQFSYTDLLFDYLGIIGFGFLAERLISKPFHKR